MCITGDDIGLMNIGKCCALLQGYSSPDSELKKELHRKDALIARLIAESKYAPCNLPVQAELPKYKSFYMMSNSLPVSPFISFKLTYIK